MTASLLVRTARSAAGLTQGAIARRAGTSATAVSAIESGRRDPSTALLERLVDAAGPASIIVAPGVWLDAARAAERAAEALRGGSVDGALRAWLDLSTQLGELSGLELAGAVLTPPGLTGDASWDAAFAGLVRHHLARHHLPAPAWVTDQRRRLDDERTLQITDLGLDLPVERETVPVEFLAHGIRVDPAWLASV